MPAGDDAPVDPRFANLDASATIELCSSLADYGEAGGLSRDLMMQVGRYAEGRYADNLEVLLAVGRMYLLGGEAARAREALVRAGLLGNDDARVLPLLDHVLDLLEDRRSAKEVLHEARSYPPESADRTSGPRSPKLPAPEPERRPVPSGRSTWGERPGGKGRSYTPTTPMTRMPGHGPARPTTPIARQGRSTGSPSLRQTPPLSDGRYALAAQADESPAPSSAQPVRTEVGRRAVARDGAASSRPRPSEADDETPSFPPPSGAPPTPPLPGSSPAPRIRILDPDDERRKLDPYELIGEIASGGMATVYLGRLGGAGGFSRFVAIKQLHPHLAREEQFVQMFLDEARLAAGIHNAHVVPILEVGMSKAGYFLVMEFIEGDTLAGLTLRLAARRTSLPAPVALRIVLDALSGLHAAHQLTDAEGVHLGLVHRDCTPQNILVGVDGSARLTDFGVARAASRLAITRPQQVKGKVAYLSPEQAHAMDLDRRSDIFTMGIVLWEILAGRSLFQADTDAATLSRVVSGPIPAARSYRPDIPAALDEICRRALHRDRNKRFRTAAEMAEALEHAAEEAPGIASPRELGKFVEATMGAELLAQREAVRAGLSPNSLGSKAPSTPSPSRPPPASLRGSNQDAASGRRTGTRPIPAPIVEPPVPPEPERDALPPPTPEPPAAKAEPPKPAPAAVEAASVEATLPTAAAPVGTAGTVGAGGTATVRERTGAATVRERAEPAAKEEAPPPAKEEAPPAPKATPAAAPAASFPATARSLVARIAGFKVSTGRGIVLAVLLVIILTAPMWLKATNRTLGHHPAAADAHGKARSTPTSTSTLDALSPAPVPSPPAHPQPAWDEGDWLPEGGLGQDDTAAPSAAPPRKK